jgi:hypothetical protein
MQRLPEAATGSLLVELRPEKGDQSVPTLEASGRRHGEVRQQREALGLPEYAVSLSSLASLEPNPAQEPKFEHAPP